jgi:CDP-4-dehydro-6-deoxyglucose reductase
MNVARKVTTILSADLLNRDVYRIRLLLPESEQAGAEFKAGQYLDICLPDGKKASFSIASAPEAGRELELHIRHMPESEFNDSIVQHLLHQPSVEVELAMGDCTLNLDELSDGQSIIFAAASTGFSQVKSIVEHLIASGRKNPIHVYWGARVEEDMYLETLPQSWAEHHSNIHFIPVVSEPEKSPGWSGRTGLLPAAIVEDVEDLSKTQVFACGSPAMVYALLDALEEQGFTQSQMKSDVFAYAPRP